MKSGNVALQERLSGTNLQAYRDALAAVKARSIYGGRQLMLQCNEPSQSQG